MADPDMAPALQVRLFGPLDIRVHGVPLASLRSRKGRWLLALLILRPNREVSREWLAGTLWPDSDDATALATLRRTLTDLRQALGDQAAVLRSPTTQTLLMDMTGVQTDLADFDAALITGEEAALTEAVALYRGPLLEGCTEEWIVPEREMRAQAYLQILEALAAKAQQRQQHTQAIHYLQLLVKIDPLQETAQRSLMRALAESGSLTGAIQAYQEFRRLLRRDLNADPDLETTALFQQLRAEARNKKSPPVSEAVEIPPPPARPRPIPSLPVPLTPFVGREQEIQELVERLETTRLLSLTGTGGVGKTRLSLRIAEEVQAAFPDGVFFVDLSALSAPELVVPHVAATLKVRENRESPLLETLCDVLATKSALLILDNCEHLLEASARLAERALQASPSLRIVATTRQALGIRGEATWRVPSLSLPETLPSSPQPTELPEHLVRYEAIRLFVERATAAMPTFALTSSSAVATVQICRHLDGIPLALELAAARMSVLSVTQIAQRLEDRFRLLTTGSRIGPRRQQTLRAAIDWSYDLLTEAERRLLQRLSIFVGGWTLEAAETICADARDIDTETATHPSRHQVDAPLDVLDILDVLAQLADRSLVVVEGSAEGVARYRLMETIREYGLERLQETETEEVLRGRHRRFYLQWAESMEMKLGGQEQVNTLARLEAEHDNLRAALAGGDAETRVRLAGALWRFWWIRGYYTEGRAWLRTALALEGEVPSEFRAKAVGGAAALAGDQSDFVAAMRYGEEFLAIRRQMGEPVGIARALNNLGLCLFFQARYAEARPLLEESLALKRDTNDIRSIGQTLGNLGMIACAEGDLERAILLHAECLAACRKAGDRQSISWALCSLGDVAMRQNDLETALPYFRESLPICQETQDRRGIAALIERVGRVFCLQGGFLQGVRLLATADREVNLLGVRLAQEEIEMHAALLAQARRRLGDLAVDTAWQEGLALPTEQAIALALNDLAPGTPAENDTF